MSAPRTRAWWVGVLSIGYGVLLGLLWAWLLWGDGKGLQRDWSGVRLLMLVPFLAAPVLLAVAGVALCSHRIGPADAMAIKGAAVIALAIKAAVATWWAIGLNAASGPFSGLLHWAAWQGLALEVVPSVVWAVVLARTPIGDGGPAPEPDSDD